MQAHPVVTSSSPPSGRGSARWWGLTLGLLTGAVDTATMVALGVRFTMNGQDVSWLVFGFFGSSFALLGWLLGWLLESRRRERRAAALIREQIEAIAAARARLVQSEKLAALGQLAASVAHEVRNPLAVIRSAAQGIGETAVDDEARRACGFITAEIDRLNSVVTSLLALARPPRLAPGRVAVRDLLDRSLALARDELAAKDIHVRRTEPDDLPPIRADGDLLCQVLLGVLANAADAVPAGGEVTLDAAARNGTVELVVADSGPGVPAELRERIFEPFFTTRREGVGLGLAVARQIVALHGGRIEVGERPGGGARFLVTLPAAA
jgi:two-component system sensor histidine kinase HydH